MARLCGRPFVRHGFGGWDAPIVDRPEDLHLPAGSSSPGEVIAPYWRGRHVAHHAPASARLEPMQAAEQRRTTNIPHRCRQVLLHCPPPTPSWLPGKQKSHHKRVLRGLGECAIILSAPISVQAPVWVRVVRGADYTVSPVHLPLPYTGRPILSNCLLWREDARLWPPTDPPKSPNLLDISVSTSKTTLRSIAVTCRRVASVVGQPRYFTDDDVRVLAFVAEHSRHGLPRCEILARLDAGELASFAYTPPEDAHQEAAAPATDTTPGQVALVLINRLSVDLDSARERERELIERLIAAEQRASRAEGELAALRSAPPRPGFWTSLFGG